MFFSCSVAPVAAPDFAADSLTAHALEAAKVQ
jgi:hypothetical protein